jgi:hypothetical protein
MSTSLRYCCKSLFQVKSLKNADALPRPHRAAGLAKPENQNHRSRRRERSSQNRTILALHRLLMRRPPIAPSKAKERSSECFYHQQGGLWYAKINMDTSKGKRWLCSVQEAEAAGCRATKQ